MVLISQIRRRQILSVAATVIAASVLVGCAEGAATVKKTSPPHESPRAVTILDARDRAGLLTVLSEHLRCEGKDTLHDDLTSYDSMTGIDCYSGNDGTFIRVYEHSTSVNQVLQDWAPTLVGSRGVLRGENWFVVGDKAVLRSVSPPVQQPTVARSVGRPTMPSTRQADETTCVQFMAAWTLKFIESPRDYEGDIGQLDRQLPGADAEIRSLANEQLVARIRSIEDVDRRQAALSTAGPDIKEFCSRTTEKPRASDSAP
ncbi:MAG: hypothetical protein JWP75_3026 [Frondihabitans sp.]|nr:hypothetical protein [Frondihabitans sp.]